MCWYGTRALGETPYPGSCLGECVGMIPSPGGDSPVTPAHAWVNVLVWYSPVTPAHAWVNVLVWYSPVTPAHAWVNVLVWYSSPGWRLPCYPGSCLGECVGMVLPCYPGSCLGECVGMVLPCYPRLMPG